MKNMLQEKFASLLTKTLRMFPAELSHDFALKSLSMVKNFEVPIKLNPSLSCINSTSVLKDLKHPIGLAAGFDKNAIACDALVKLGFSFLEVGTATKISQTGNKKPRLFRFSDSRNIINRMGFNNQGIGIITQRVKEFKQRYNHQKIGINVGKGRDTPIEVAIDDYVFCYEKIREISDYIVFNISSPNTPNLRNLANSEFLQNLDAQIDYADKSRIFVKLDPDMSKAEFQRVIECIQKIGFAGVILTNTLKVTSPQVGGLSGHSLISHSNQMLEWAFEVHKGSMFMIASGGILNGIDIFNKLSRGAQLVQIYTAMVYRGPYVVQYLLKELDAYMKQRGFDQIEDVIGSYYIES